MARFLAGNLAKAALLLLAVSAVAFFLVGMSPIDPISTNVGQAAYTSMSDAKRAQLAAYWGTDVPIWRRYLAWLAAALQGDWGTSLRYNAPVTQVIATRFLNSLALMAVAWVLSGILGLALGVAAGACRGRWPDKLVKGLCYVLSSTPTFWLGLVALMVFSVWLGWLPLGFSVPIGKTAAEVTLADAASHLILPALVLSLTGLANIALHTREKLIDVMESDYARFARARGLGTWQAVRRHGLRNLALPALTLQFASISEVFGGSVLVEQVFSYPGLGQAAVTAATGGDAPLLAGIAVASAAFVFAGNLAANLLYGLVDPRMRKETLGVGRPRAKVAAPAPGRDDEEKKARRPLPAAGAPVRVGAGVMRASAAVREALSQGTLLHAPRRALPNRTLTLVKLAGALVVLACVAVAGRLLSDVATTTDFASKGLAPCLAHPFGTDWMGRDMLARTLTGLSTSILVGLLAATVSSVIAVALGCVAALGGKRADAVVSWLVDLMMGVPHIVLLILISYALGKGFWGVAVGVAVTHWPSLARVIRAEVLQCKNSDFVACAYRLGKGRVHVAVRHMLPYVLPQFLVGLVLMFPHAILHEASITFLGFGLSPEQPAIGVILSEAMGYLSAGMWWLAVFPGLALVAVVLLFDLAGASARRLADPHTSQE